MNVIRVLFTGFISISDRVSRLMAKIAAVVLLVLVFLTLEQVVARYFFDASSVALQELQWHLFGAIFLLAAPHAIKTQDHVRVDIIYGRMDKQKKRWVDTFGILAFLLPMGLAMGIYGWGYVVQARSYPNFQALDAWTQTILAKDGTLYGLFASIETSFRKIFLVGEVSPDPGGLGGRWLIKALIPLSGFLMSVQGLAECFRLWLEDDAEESS